MLFLSPLEEEAREREKERHKERERASELARERGRWSQPALFGKPLMAVCMSVPRIACVLGQLARFLNNKWLEDAGPIAGVDFWKPLAGS